MDTGNEGERRWLEMKMTLSQNNPISKTHPKSENNILGEIVEDTDEKIPMRDGH